VRCAVKSRLKYNYLKHRSIPLTSSPRTIPINTVFKITVVWLFKLAFKLISITQKYTKEYYTNRYRKSTKSGVEKDLEKHFKI